MIALTSDWLSVDIDEDRGADLHQVVAFGEHPLLWTDDARSPLPSTAVNRYPSTALDWLSHYRGGWQGLFPNAGADSDALGVPLPFHGETSTAAWQVVESSTTSATLETAARLPLTIRRTVSVATDEARLTIRERITNESDLQVPYLWGHHPAWLAGSDTRLDLPSCRIVSDPGFDTDLNDLAVDSSGSWPLAVGKSGGPVDVSTIGERSVERLARLHDLAGGWFAIRWEDRAVGACVTWDLETFPWVWYWAEIGGPDFPWFGRARIIALEPVNASLGDGLAATRARGEGGQLGPRASRESVIHVNVFATHGQAVTDIDASGHPMFAIT